MRLLQRSVFISGCVIGGCLGLGPVFTASGGPSATTTQQDPSPSGHEAQDRARPHETETSRVDLNTADQMTLETLPGIGPKTAALILEYREEQGAFEKVEEIMNIRGIGERTFLRLRPLIDVSSPADES